MPPSGRRVHAARAGAGGALGLRQARGVGRTDTDQPLSGRRE